MFEQHDEHHGPQPHDVFERASVLGPIVELDHRHHHCANRGDRRHTAAQKRCQRGAYDLGDRLRDIFGGCDDPPAPEVDPHAHLPRVRNTRVWLTCHSGPGEQIANTARREDHAAESHQADDEGGPDKVCDAGGWRRSEGQTLMLRS